MLVLLVPAPASAALPPLVSQSIHFEVPGHDLIPNVAAFRASCNAVASGEPLALQNNETVRTTVAAAPGPCSMILVLFGFDVPIPTINTTPIGRNLYSIPGVSLPTLGLVDVSLDLKASLNTTTRVADPAVALVEGGELDWGSWGTQRVVVRGADGYGSVVASTIGTTYTYALSLGLTIWIAGIQAYETSLADFGAYAGTPALVTPLSVDLLPHPLTLGPARQITYQGATLNWTGTIDADMDHLELWVTDGTTNVSYRITDRVVSAMTVPLRADTAYRAGIVAVDASGQAVASPSVGFRTLAAPPPETAAPVTPPVTTEGQANVIVIGTFSFIALLAALVAYGFGRVRGRI